MESVHWVGTATVKGLRRQAEELLQASRCECNLRRWRPPVVVIFFPSKVDPDVRSRLEDMGVHVASGPGESMQICKWDQSCAWNTVSDLLLTESNAHSLRPSTALHCLDSLSLLPPPPELKSVANLDVTTLCAMCSEVGR